VESSDNQTWTITIKDGWTFHNGEPVTAQNYVDAWNATAYGPNAWANSGSFAKVKGYADLNPAEGQPTVKEMSGVRGVDPHPQEVQLTAPDSQFPLAMATGPAFMPLPKVAFDDLDAYDKAPIGDGPYKLVGTPKPDVSMELTKYAEYKGPKPGADGLTFKFYNDLHTAYTDAQGDSVDIFRVPVDKWPHVAKDFGDRFTAFKAPALQYLGFPFTDKRFEDVRVRKAISMSIDREAINTSIFGGLNQPAKSITSPAHRGSPADLCDYCAFDPARAKQLLAEAGGWSGGTMQIWLPGGLGYEPLFTAIANQIRQNLGIGKVEIKALPGFTPFFEALGKKEVDGPYRGMWGSFYPSMAELLTELFSKTGGGQFATGYVNDEAIKLVQEGNAQSSEADQVARYVEAEKLILADAPVVPLFYDSYVYAWSKKVTDVEIDLTPINITKVKVKP
jgi:peptide/nickel transport system substrate-binding protein/oligopeptide transport system substrate-binding protein